MKEGLQQLEARIDSMQLRERALLLLAGIVVIFFLVDTFGLQPVYKQQKQSKQTISALETELDLLRLRSDMLYGDPETDPLLHRDQLLKKLAVMKARLNDQLGVLLTPDQAVEVLKQVLDQEKGLKLREVDAATRPLTGTEFMPDTAAQVAGIARYDLQLQLEGSYLATLRYLHTLDELPWRFFWEDVDFKVIEYPNAHVTLNIYTLGLREGG
jgi:MSHA biogenesis protein MshJ